MKALLGRCLAQARTRLRIRGGGYQPTVFDDIYQSNKWNDAASRSGPGSNLDASAAVRRELPRILRSLDAASMLDAPCGDFYWLSTVDLGEIAYTGVDVVKALIEHNRRTYGGPNRTFIQTDIVEGPLPQADFVLCRDCLVHLPFREGLRVVDNVRRSGSRYLATTTFTDHRRNRDIYTGGWRRLNLCKPPFSFPSPLALINEEYPFENGKYADKSLGIWRLSDIPVPGV